MKGKNHIVIGIYFAISVLVLVFYFNLKEPSRWLGKIESYYEFRNQSIEKNPSLEEKKIMRYGTSYQIAQQVKKMIEDQKLVDPVILLEPASYLQQHNYLKEVLPEPIVFYYLSGVKVAWTSSPYAQKATHLLVIRNNQISLQPISDKQHLANILKTYKSYVNKLL